jgi:hypothetical protein
MEHSQGNSGQTFRGSESAKTSVTTDNLVDFVQARALRKPVKEIQRDTGLSKKQVENIRQGISGVSGRTLTNWCISDPAFAAEYMAYVGLILPGEAEFAGALTQAFNAYQRKQGDA